MTDEILQFPISAIKQIAPALVVNWDEGYRQSLRDRAWKIAGAIWLATDPPPEISWNEVCEDKRYEVAKAKCLATCELIIRLVDVINAPIGRE